MRYIAVLVGRWPARTYIREEKWSASAAHIELVVHRRSDAQVCNRWRKLFSLHSVDRRQISVLCPLLIKVKKRAASCARQRDNALVIDFHHPRATIHYAFLESGRAYRRTLIVQRWIEADVLAD